MHYQDALKQTSLNKRDLTAPSIPEALLAIHPRELFQEIDDIYENCSALQEMLLQEICLRGQNSRFGQKYKMAEITSLEQWRQKMPLTVYEDYRPYIEQSMQGADDQLFSAPVKMYIATTGSSGALKYFAESAAGDAAKQLVMAIRGMYMAQLLPVTLDMQAKNLTISNYASLGKSADGKLIVRASGQTARNMRRKTGTMNILPVEFWETEGLTSQEIDYMMCVYALAEEHLAKVFCNNLYHFGRLLRLIEQESASMINDIRTGIFSVPLTEETRAKLAPTFQASPARADYLARLAQDNGGRLADNKENIARIWPELEMTGCWLSAAVGRDAQEVLASLPDKIRSIDLGYGASEGKFNIPLQLGSPAGAIAPFAMVYEFLSLKTDQCLWAWEVEEGEYYELVISTYSGLYRYQLGDVVQIKGFVGKTPLLEFCSKRSECFELQGEKIYAFQILQAVKDAEKSLGFSADLLQIYADKEGYDLVVQGIDPLAMPEFISRVALGCEQAVRYRPRKYYLMDTEYKPSLFKARVRANRNICGIKLPLMLGAEPAEHILAEY